MRRILVVDDEQHVRRMLAACLSRAGYEVSVAKDGAEALKCLAQEPADLIVLDLLMPEKEGLETLMALRHNPERPPIIVISGGARALGSDFLPVARKLGANITLQKPFQNQELLDAVAELLPSERGGD